METINLNKLKEEEVEKVKLARFKFLKKRFPGRDPEMTLEDYEALYAERSLGLTPVGFSIRKRRASYKPFRSKVAKRDKDGKWNKARHRLPLSMLYES